MMIVVCGSHLIRQLGGLTSFTVWLAGAGADRRYSSPNQRVGWVVRRVGAGRCWLKDGSILHAQVGLRWYGRREGIALMVPPPVVRGWWWTLRRKKTPILRPAGAGTAARGDFALHGVAQPPRPPGWRYG